MFLCPPFSDRKLHLLRSSKKEGDTCTNEQPCRSLYVRWTIEHWHSMFKRIKPSMMSKNLSNNAKVREHRHSRAQSVFIDFVSPIGIPADEQRLTLGGISLNDELTLEESRVEAESTLYVLLDLEGGGKKRKKKNYSTPKKNKHKHKKVKLAVLKYYKVRPTDWQRSGHFPPLLSGRRDRQDSSFTSRMSLEAVWRWCVYGCPCRS